MDKMQKKRIDAWIETQKSGTDEEIKALPHLKDFCGKDDKQYLITHWLPAFGKIDMHRNERYKLKVENIEKMFSKQKIS